MVFDCTEECDRKGNKGFATRKSRSIHQSKCKHMRALEQLLFAPPEPESQDESSRASKRCRTDDLDIDQSLTPEIPLPEPLSATFDNTGAPTVEFNPVSQGDSNAMHARPVTRSHARRLHLGFRDQHDALPEGPEALQPEPIHAVQQAPVVQPSAHPRRRRQPFVTKPDAFGRYRVYYSRPDSIPDTNAPITLLAAADNPPTHSQSISNIISPCPNISAFYIQRYFWLSGQTKSLNDRDSLCYDAIIQPDFNPKDLVGISFRKLDDELAEAAKTWVPTCRPSEGWRNIPLRVEIPPVPGVPSFHYDVPGFRARSLIDVMRRQFSHNDPSIFHYDPFESYVLPPGAPPGTPAVEIRDQIYSSPAMMRAHREIQALKIEESNCKLPRCVGAWMFSSDGVQFGNFCHAKGWPIFGYFGNVDKYERCKPLSNTCFHIAHVPTLPDAIAEKIAELYGRPPTDGLLTHLRRELMHEVWKALLDNEFVHAWHNGIVIKCADGVTRRVFPRIITYSADYPEKVLIAAIRNNGTCLCPRCLVRKLSASQMGCPHDVRLRVVKRRVANNKYREKIARARDLIYGQGRVVASTSVEDILKGESYVPTLNAFSSRLGNSFNIFAALVVDQLHEVELGVWKAVFQHLVRLLYVSGHHAVVEFNKRFRAVPTFGSTIRLFSEDVASMSRLAARDFEDILQCCIPVFEGPLPPVCDVPAQELIFIFAEWHSLAKLRLHTSVTLKIMKQLTSKLGVALRDFAKLTENMDIRETPKEYARRKRQYELKKTSNMTKNKSKAGNPKGKASKAPELKDTGDGRRQCGLNLNTYKMHSLGDYVRTIEEYGTTDSYSTQIGELQNRKIKSQYTRTNRRDAVEQMTRIDDICCVLKDMDDELKRRAGHTTSCEIDVESILGGDPYSIGARDRSEDMIPSISHWANNLQHDDAVKYFIPQLKRHLLGRILGNRDPSDLGDAEVGLVHFHQDRMYRHRTLRMNYTTYDVLRHQDVINPSTHHCFALLPAEFQPDSNAHPYIYAKILGVYHAKVGYRDKLPRRLDFVHVRWLYYDYDRPGGWESRRLDRLSYAQSHTEQDIIDSFDFVDPKDIIRAAHIIPDFQSGVSLSFLRTPRSIAHDNTDHTDWTAFYVNRFVDRDMVMRYIGKGVGHYKQDIGQTAVQPEDSIAAAEQSEDEKEDEDDTGDRDDNGDDGDEDDGVEDIDDESIVGSEFGGGDSDADGSVTYEDAFDEF